MMEKLKADVMGTSLKWEVFLEVEYKKGEIYDRLPPAWKKNPKKMVVSEGSKKKPEKLSLHTFKTVGYVKENKVKPWYEEDIGENKDEKVLAGLELEEFIKDLDTYF